jgi:hypothetical protein
MGLERRLVLRIGFGGGEGAGGSVLERVVRTVPPQRLKPSSQLDAYRSGEPLRHPRSKLRGGERDSLPSGGGRGLLTSRGFHFVNSTLRSR